MQTWLFLIFLFNFFAFKKKWFYYFADKKSPVITLLKIFLKLFFLNSTLLRRWYSDILSIYTFLSRLQLHLILNVEEFSVFPTSIYRWLSYFKFAFIYFESVHLKFFSSISLKSIKKRQHIKKTFWSCIFSWDRLFSCNQIA